jgi:hypothetical protein
MWQTALLTFLAGILGGNAIPHFVKGITRERYPTVFGASPVVNLVVGWTGLVVAALLLKTADVGAHAIAAALTGSLGLLVMGLFHAGPGAFGRRP